MNKQQKLQFLKDNHQKIGHSFKKKLIQMVDLTGYSGLNRFT